MPDIRFATALLLCLTAAGCRAPERIEANPCLAATAQVPMGPRLEAALDEVAGEAGLAKDISQADRWQYRRSDASVALTYVRPAAASGGVVALFRAAGGAPESDAERTLRAEIGEFPLWFPGIVACSQVAGLQAPALVD